MASKYLNASYISTKLKDEDDKNEKETVKDQTETKLEKIKSATPQNQTNKEDDSSKVYSNEELAVELENIRQKYKYGDYVDAPDSLGLEKIEVPEKTEEELISLAKSSLDKKYETQKKSTTSSFEKQIEDIINSKDSITAAAANQSSEINNLYDNSIAKTEEQALKRGLARSSIVINQLSNLEGERANNLATILNNLQNDLTNNEEKIAQLEKEKEMALSELDVEYALDLQEQIEKQKQDYQDKRQEAIDFNNTIAKLEAEYKLDLDKQKQANKKQSIEMNEKYGVNYTQGIIAQKQFEFLKNYFDTLEPAFALNQFLTSSSLKSVLGNNYSTLYQHLSKRLQNSQNN